MFIIKSTRNSALDSGVWVTYQGCRFRIAHTSHTRFQRKLASLQAPFRKQIEKGSMDPDDTRDIVCTALADAILKDWDGVKDESGEITPFSFKMARTALLNDEAFREFVQETAANLESFREEEIVDKGNA
jgi:hypothetical protein